MGEKKCVCNVYQRLTQSRQVHCTNKITIFFDRELRSTSSRINELSNKPKTRSKSTQLSWSDVRRYRKCFKRNYCFFDRISFSSIFRIVRISERRKALKENSSERTKKEKNHKFCSYIFRRIEFCNALTWRIQP